MDNMMRGKSRMKKEMVVVRGDLYGTPRRSAPPKAEHFSLKREMHAVYLRMRGPEGSIVSRALYKVCCDDQKPWEMMTRRGDEAIDGNVDVETIIEPLRVLERYFRERCARRDGQWPKRAA